MADRVAIYRASGNTRSGVICKALEAGIRAAGDLPVPRDEADYGAPETRVAAHYGLAGKLQRVFDDHRTDGRAVVYIDLGYWGRRPSNNRWIGYHKLSVNDRHPTAYFQRRPHPMDRARALDVEPQPWRTGSHILLCGMGDKGAPAEGFRPEEWERAAIATLRQYTDRPIVYRPKPSWKTARPIEGCGYSPGSIDIAVALEGAHAVVTHHSNAAVDGLVAGVPAFCWKGVASPMALQDLSRIESPWRPDGREQWIADVAHCQWSVAEITDGSAWRHLKDEGLV